MVLLALYMPLCACFLAKSRSLKNIGVKVAMVASSIKISFEMDCKYEQ